jgi:hypothetical protein
MVVIRERVIVDSGEGIIPRRRGSMERVWGAVNAGGGSNGRTGECHAKSCRWPVTFCCPHGYGHLVVPRPLDCSMVPVVEIFDVPVDAFRASRSLTPSDPVIVALRRGCISLCGASPSISRVSTVLRAQASLWFKQFPKPFRSSPCLRASVVQAVAVFVFRRVSVVHDRGDATTGAKVRDLPRSRAIVIVTSMWLGSARLK